MAYYYDEDEDDDEDDGDFEDHSTYNVQSGWTENSVQTRDVYGDINFHGDDREYFTALHWGFSVAIYVVLFLVAAGYALAVTYVTVSFWDWVKLLLSTALLFPVLVATEYRLHGVEFGPFRVLLSIVIVVLGVTQSGHVGPFAGICDVIADWLVWRF